MPEEKKPEQENKPSAGPKGQTTNPTKAKPSDLKLGDVTDIFPQEIRAEANSVDIYLYQVIQVLEEQVQALRVDLTKARAEIKFLRFQLDTFKNTFHAHQHIYQRTPMGNFWWRMKDIKDYVNDDAEFPKFGNMTDDLWVLSWSKQPMESGFDPNQLTDPPESPT